MGISTFLNKKSAGSNPQRKVVRLGFDVPLLLALVTLLVFGMLMVYSASWDFSRAVYGDPGQIFNRQLLFISIGIILALIIAFVDYHIWMRLAVPAMLVTILALTAVLVINEVRLGASRTLSAGSYQPSELAKLITVLYLGVWLYSKRDYLNHVSFGLFPLAGILGLVGGLIFLQPDVSAVLTIVLLGGLLFFLAGGDLKQIILVLLLTTLVGWLVVSSRSTGIERVQSFWDGIRDPTEASYHVQRSIEAFVNGGWFGVGIGNATTKLTGLPVPQTDSIFAVVGEELGIIGASVLVICYIVLLWRGMEIAKQAPDSLGALLAGGLSVWIALEALINMAVIVNLLPFAGNALPFISAGGSNMIVSMIAMGIIINVSRLSLKEDPSSPNTYGPVRGPNDRKIYSVKPGSSSERVPKKLDKKENFKSMVKKRRKNRRSS